MLRRLMLALALTTAAACLPLSARAPWLGDHEARRALNLCTGSGQARCHRPRQRQMAPTYARSPDAFPNGFVADPPR